jgi:hypothetical protein
MTVLALLGCIWSLPAFAESEPSYSLEWKSPRGKVGLSTAKLVTVNDENGMPQLYLAWPSPFQNVKSVTQAGDDGQQTPIPVRKSSSGVYVLLNRKSSSLEFTNPNGQSLKITYKLKPSASLLVLSNACQKLGYKMMAVAVPETSLPAAVDCQKSGEDFNVIFSTLEESEWASSKAFEVSGKGQRWKLFAAKDIAALGVWEISWGESNKMAKYKIQAPVSFSSPTPGSSFQFLTGMKALNAKADFNSKSTDIQGLQIPIAVRFQNPNAMWYLGSQYDFFALNFKSQSENSPSLSALSLWAGIEKYGTKYRGSVQAGYRTQSLSLPEIRLSANLEAPFAQIEAAFLAQQKEFGALASFASTSSQGNYTEAAAGLFYQDRFFWKKIMRIQFLFENLETSQNALDLKMQTQTLEVSVSF